MVDEIVSRGLLKQHEQARVEVIDTFHVVANARDVPWAMKRTEGVADCASAGHAGKGRGHRADAKAFGRVFEVRSGASPPEVAVFTQVVGIGCLFDPENAVARARPCQRHFVPHALRGVPSVVVDDEYIVVLKVRCHWCRFEAGRLWASATRVI